MRTSRKTDFRKLKITLVSMTYYNQRPQCPSLSPHVLLITPTSAPVGRGWAALSASLVASSSVYALSAAKSVFSARKSLNATTHCHRRHHVPCKLL